MGRQHTGGVPLTVFFLLVYLISLPGNYYTQKYKFMIKTGKLEFLGLDLGYLKYICLSCHLRVRALLGALSDPKA